jgi:hypothetical protein
MTRSGVAAITEVTDILTDMADIGVADIMHLTEEAVPMEEDSILTMVALVTNMA